MELKAQIESIFVKAFRNFAIVNINLVFLSQKAMLSFLKIMTSTLIQQAINNGDL
jgi:hypothetical protein